MVPEISSNILGPPLRLKLNAAARDARRVNQCSDARRAEADACAKKQQFCLQTTRDVIG
jgi:hypothetical protein